MMVAAPETVGLNVEEREASPIVSHPTAAAAVATPAVGGVFGLPSRLRRMHECARLAGARHYRAPGVGVALQSHTLHSSHAMRC